MRTLTIVAIIATAAVTGTVALAAPPDLAGGAGRMPPDLAGAGPMPGPPPFISRLFPPKLVMEHQHELALRPAQLDTIKQAMRDTQKQLLELQWQLDADTEALTKLLDAPHADEATVLKQFDAVIEIERQVKKANFVLLLRVKNQLDPEQQEKLRPLLPTRAFGPPAPP